MPLMDGVQFLAEVRERSPDSVRVILSHCSPRAGPASNKGSSGCMGRAECPSSTYIGSIPPIASPVDEPSMMRYRGSWNERMEDAHVELSSGSTLPTLIRYRFSSPPVL